MMRKFAIVAAAFMLQSCYYSYPVLAKVIGGQLAFVSGDNDFDCIATIGVSYEGPRQPDPAIDNLDDLEAKGDAISRVRAAWRVSGIEYECKADYPVFYGAKFPDQEETDPAQKLRANEPYSVMVGGPNASGGHGCFRITRLGHVENLDFRECSTVEPMPPQPAAPVRAIVSLPRPLVRPATYIEPGDYPPASVRAREEGTVRYVVDVGPDGRATGCTVTRSSGFKRLDAATCPIMLKRGIFFAATDNMGGFGQSARLEQELKWSLRPGAMGQKRPSEVELGAELIVWDVPANTARAPIRYGSMAKCREVLAQIARKGRREDKRFYCLPEPTSNYKPAPGKGRT